MTELDYKYTEEEIMEYLNNGKKVFIDCGAVNDAILSYRTKPFKTYTWQRFYETEVFFETSACVFPKEIQLNIWDNVTTEDFKGNLFVHVS